MMPVPFTHMMGRLMMSAVRDLEGEFRAAVAAFQAAKANKERAEAEYGQADCELNRARSVHAAARDRYLDAKFYGKPFEVEQPDPAANEINAAVHAARTRVGMAAVERGIGKPKGLLCGAQGKYGASGAVFECALEQGHSGKHRS